MGRTLAFSTHRKRAVRHKERAHNKWVELRGLKQKSTWVLSHARCTGSSHIKSGLPCQDWTSTRLFDDGVYAIALSDGAGSSKYSHYGASYIVNRTPQLIADHFEEAFKCFDESFARRLTRLLQKELNVLAGVGLDIPDAERIKDSLPDRDTRLLVPCTLSDLACTLLCVVVKGNRYVAVHIGDGVIGAETARNSMKELVVISKPDNGEFANETQFVTSRGAEDHVRIVHGKTSNMRRQITGFLLMSDGPEAALYKKSENRLAPACSNLLEASRNLEADEMNTQLESALKNVVASKTRDDCSFAMMALKP